MSTNFTEGAHPFSPLLLIDIVVILFFSSSVFPITVFELVKSVKFCWNFYLSYLCCYDQLKIITDAAPISTIAL
jgi:hypothetical protein